MGRLTISRRRTFLTVNRMNALYHTNPKKGNANSWNAIIRFPTECRIIAYPFSYGVVEKW